MFVGLGLAKLSRIKSLIALSAANIVHEQQNASCQQNCQVTPGKKLRPTCLNGKNPNIYLSHFIEISTGSSLQVIIPQIVLSDNGPQYTSNSFANFSQQYGYYI